MRSMVEKANGKMQLYFTLGQYDFVMIVEVPNDETILELLRSLGSMGNVRTATMKAWTESESATVLK